MGRHLYPRIRGIFSYLLFSIVLVTSSLILLHFIYRGQINHYIRVRGLPSLQVALRHINILPFKFLNLLLIYEAFDNCLSHFIQKDSSLLESKEAQLSEDLTTTTFLCLSLPSCSSLLTSHNFCFNLSYLLLLTLCEDILDDLCNRVDSIPITRLSFH